MSFTFRPAAPPPPTSSAFGKMPQFVGKLVVVIPYDKTLSKFKDEYTGKPQEQTRAKVIPIDGGSHTNPKTGEETSWNSGDVLDVYVSQKRIQGQISELGKPILGRVLMDGKAWILATPTEADVAKATKVVEALGDIEIPEPGSSKGSTADDDSNGVPW